MFIPEQLLNEQFDDRYFDVVNALDESQQIYFKNNNLAERLLTSAEPFVIGETGFGAGRIVVSLLEYIKMNQLSSVPIEYYSVELFPMSHERMLSILDVFKERVPDEIAAVTEAYSRIDLTIPGWHTIKIKNILLNLWLGEALEMVYSLKKCCDVWFLDGHSPKKNPSIWRPELLMEVGKKTKPNGTCSTFTVSGAVKRALTEAGFTLSKLPGCGGKNEVLHGVKL